MKTNNIEDDADNDHEMFFDDDNDVPNNDYY
jgi:hypothetical protein